MIQERGREPNRLEALERQGVARRPMRRFLFASCVGIIAGLLVAALVQWILIEPSEDDPRQAGLTGRSARGVTPQAMEMPEIKAALDYAQAVQTNDVETILASIHWVRERLAYMDMVMGDPSAREEARARLGETLVDRAPEGNALAAEGVEDQYVFRPGAHIEVVAADEGREGLEQPVARRVWLRVTYPSPTAALRDNAGNPIHALNVGVNISREGGVLKSNVLGNLDIDFNSVSVAW